MSLTLHHIAIICSDFARSKHFYSDVLGLRIVREVFRAERNSWKLDLALDNGMFLELFSFPDPPKRPSYPEACGARHIAFGVEKLNAEIERLKQHGVECEPIRIDEMTGARFTFFSDPDGLPLELYEKAPATVK